PNEPAYSSDIRSEKESNVHLSAATTREEFIAFRQERDRTLPLPELFFFALQVNVRAGRFAPEAANCTRQLHVTIHLPHSWSGSSSERRPPLRARRALPSNKRSATPKSIRRRGSARRSRCLM